MTRESIGMPPGAPEIGRLDDLVRVAAAKYASPEGTTTWLVHYPAFGTFVHPTDWPHGRIALEDGGWRFTVAQRKVENGRWAASLCTTFICREGEVAAESRAAARPFKNILRRAGEYTADEILEDLAHYVISAPPISKREALAIYDATVPVAARPAHEQDGLALHQRGTVLSRLLERNYLGISPAFADYTALTGD